MKTWDFDTIIDRHHTDAFKYGMLQSTFGREDLLSLWVADMDFATPDFILDALRKRLDHPILGYTLPPDDYWPSVIDWTREHHGWEIQPDWLCSIPGIVKAIGLAVNIFVGANEKVIIQPPVYHHFRLSVVENNRQVVNNPLKENKGSYEMDFEQLEQVCDDTCRMLILSNPHNPAGICWSRETLQQLAHFCYERNILVLSDEIHCDMTLFGHKHIPFASVSEEAAACSITFAAPTKTFNIAGVISAYAITPNPELRSRFYGWLHANELDWPPMFSPIITVAAFRQGEAWRKQMLSYVEKNVEFVEQFCQSRMPKIRPWRPEASFLIWLDCRALGLDHNALQDVFVNRARVAFNDGEMFGTEGKGFMRVNVGTPHAVLQEALERVCKAVQTL